jgi:hypothetical protein
MVSTEGPGVVRFAVVVVYLPLSRSSSAASSEVNLPANGRVGIAGCERYGVNEGERV